LALDCVAVRAVAGENGGKKDPTTSFNHRHRHPSPITTDHDVRLTTMAAGGNGMNQTQPTMTLIVT